jgi:hypothetical protein
VVVAYSSIPSVGIKKSKYKKGYKPKTIMFLTGIYSSEPIFVFAFVSNLRNECQVEHMLIFKVG